MARFSDLSDTRFDYYTKEEIDGIRDIQGRRREPFYGDPTERKPFEVTPEDREAFEAFKVQRERERIQAIGRGGLNSARECVRQMVESGLFEDGEIERYVLDVYQRSIPVACEIAEEFGILGCTPGPKPEDRPAPSAEELWGGPAYVEQELPDGSKFSRPATPDEVKRMRQEAILGAGTYQRQLEALRADPTAFDD